MAKILYAWELGGGYGHIDRIFPIGERLQTDGHSLTYALRNLALAGKRASGRPALLQAPMFTDTPDAPAVPVNYSDILLRCGYADAQQLMALVEGWLHMFRLCQPDLLLFDHAPTAMLAAKILALPGCNIGTGFLVPPTDAPTMPDLQPWRQTDLATLQAADHQLLASINQVLNNHDCSPIDRVGELMQDFTPILLTWPETDHYGPRHEAEYLGPLLNSSGRAQHDGWAQADHPRVFAYLTDYYKFYQPVVQQLAASQINVLMHVRQQAQQHSPQVNGDKLYLSTQPIDLEWALPHSDLIICHGGQATVNFALKHGVPLLILPQQLEQSLMTYRLNRQGLVASLDPTRGIHWSKAISRLINHPEMQRNRQNFCNRHANHDNRQVLRRAVDIMSARL
jgi:UDP:flavonoid glycosyltransferase YjiC (YdhE family)